MAKTLEELERELAEVCASVRQLVEDRPNNSKDLSDLRDEIVKLQASIGNSKLDKEEEKQLKKKIRHLKAMPFWDIFSEPEYEEIEVNE